MLDINLMIVEDDDLLREQMERMLRREISEVVSYPLASAAIENLERFAPDIIVTDIRMPGMSGLEMIEYIRERHGHIPFIVTSAYSEANYFIKAIDLNVESFVVKPINMERLLFAINHIAEQIQVKRELQASHELYSNFFENSSSANAIYRTEDGGESFKVVKVNRAFEELERLSRDEAVGKNLLEIFPGMELSGLFKVFSEVYATGRPCHLPLMNLTLSGRELWRENYVFRLSPNEIVASYIDRTNEKMLEEERIENYEKTLLSLIELIEQRDTYTGGHSQRVATYCRAVAREMGCSDEECDLVYRAGILHDIGKISTPDAILLKPGSLNESEYELIQYHVDSGVQMLSKNPMYRHVSDIVRAHHERIDGSGYPGGLKGEAIPLLARIMAVCDSYDAMTTDRIYKGKKSKEEALAELQSLSGRHYDTEVVRVATEVLPRVAFDEPVSQFPANRIEQQRLAFFFKDQTTGAYNAEYLDAVLKMDGLEQSMKCLNALYITGFTGYNERHGWKEGDRFLRAFVKNLQAHYPQAHVFRIHGDDFILLTGAHTVVDPEMLEREGGFLSEGLTLRHEHYDIGSRRVRSIEELETLLEG